MPRIVYEERYYKVVRLPDGKLGFEPLDPQPTPEDVMIQNIQVWPIQLGHIVCVQKSVPGYLPPDEEPTDEDAALANKMK